MDVHGCPWVRASFILRAIPFKKPKQVTSKSFRHYEPFASDSSSRVDGRCSQADSHLFRVRKFSWMHVILKPLVLSPDSPIKPEQCGAHRYSVSSKFNHEFWKASLTPTTNWLLSSTKYGVMIQISKTTTNCIVVLSTPLEDENSDWHASSSKSFRKILEPNESLPTKPLSSLDQCICSQLGDLAAAAGTALGSNRCCFVSLQTASRRGPISTTKIEFFL